MYFVFIVLIVIVLILKGNAINEQALVNKYSPIYLFRHDTQQGCFPVKIEKSTRGTKAGCVGLKEFERTRDSIPVYYEIYTSTPNNYNNCIITYFLYYSYQPLCMDMGITKGGDHSDDWEKVSIIIKNGKAIYTVFNQHNGRYITPYQKEVYIGKYSHGSYHNKQRKCSLTSKIPFVKKQSDSTCYRTGEYCRYFSDPRNGKIRWIPKVFRQTKDIPSLNYYEESPLTKLPKPHDLPVCTTKGGKPIPLLNDYANTCAKNPKGLRDENMKLKDIL